MAVRMVEKRVVLLVVEPLSRLEPLAVAVMMMPGLVLSKVKLNSQYCNKYCNSLQNQDGTYTILKEKPNLSFFEIPLIYELSTFKRFWVNNGMRFGIPDAAARKRTITVYTNRDEFFKISKMKEDEIYALLINKDGKILWSDEGVVNDKKIKDLMKVIDS